MFPNRRPHSHLLHSSENLRMYKPGFVLVFFLGLAQYAQAALPSTESGWSAFTDPRSGTRVEYPAGFSSDGRLTRKGQRLVTRMDG
jgi:hypothetical protein